MTPTWSAGSEKTTCHCTGSVPEFFNTTNCVCWPLLQLNCKFVGVTWSQPFVGAAVGVFMPAFGLALVTLDTDVEEPTGALLCEKPP